MGNGSSDTDNIHNGNDNEGIVNINSNNNERSDRAGTGEGDSQRGSEYRGSENGDSVGRGNAAELKAQPNNYRSNRRKRQDIILSKARPDLSEEQRKGFLDFLDTIDRKEYGKDYELVRDAAFTWFAAGTIKPEEDMYKVKQAVEVLRREGLVGKRSFDEWKSPMELINSFPKTGYRVQNPPTNPDTVSCLVNKKEIGNGVTIYEIDEPDMSDIDFGSGRTYNAYADDEMYERRLSMRQQLRDIINTHLGVDRSPWCLLQGDDKGGLSKDSDYYWRKYNSHTKRMAFKDGKLTAFFANDTKTPLWWDINDNCHDNIPYIGKMDGDKLGRTAEYEFDEETGEMSGPLSIYKGNKAKGRYEEWSVDTGKQTLLENRNEKGELVGERKEWYDNGQKKTTGNYKDGKRDGERKEWYDTGQLKTVEHYKDGKRDGEQLSYNGDGKLSERHNFKNGAEDGLQETFFEDGKLSERYTARDGEKNGLFEAYSFLNHDQIALRSNYKNNWNDGLFEMWYSNGQMQYRHNYKDGLGDGLCEDWDANGNLIRKVNYTDGRENGGYSEFYANGQLKEHGNYVNGRKDGEFRSYYDNGELSTVGSYKDGVPVGNHKAFFKNGRLWKSANMDEQGRRSGEYVEYNSDGKVVYSGTYKNSVQDGDFVSRDFEDGHEITAYKHYDYGSQNGVKRVYTDGVLSETCEYKDGRKDGVERVYNNDAGTVACARYERDKKVEEWTEKIPAPSGQQPKNYKLPDRKKDNIEAKEELPNEDKQGNPVDASGRLIKEKVNSIDELTDEDFTNPKRSVELPKLPDIVDKAIGNGGRPVIIKKNILVRNNDRHGDLTPEQSRKILNKALYTPRYYGQNQKESRPHNWVLICAKNNDGLYRLVLVEINKDKESSEVVHWYSTTDRGLNKIRKQAEKEGGQILILPSDDTEESGTLSGLQSGSSAANVRQNSGTGKEQEQINYRMPSQNADGEAEEQEQPKGVSTRSVNAFAKKHGVQAENVRMFAEAMAREDAKAAARAYDEMYRDIAKTRKTGRLVAMAALDKDIQKKKFGDFDALQDRAYKERMAKQEEKKDPNVKLIGGERNIYFSRPDAREEDKRFGEALGKNGLHGVKWWRKEADTGSGYLARMAVTAGFWGCAMWILCDSLNGRK